MDSTIWTILGVISAICGLLTGAYGLYFGVIGVLGTLKRRKKEITAKPEKRIAALIAARNEEAVIPHLVRSLKKQNYPADLFDVYVIPNNCTDDTEAAALNAGAKIIPCDVPVKSKGEVLNVAFRQLKDEGYDAYCIFDADNLVDANYLNVVNQTLQDGYEIAQGYRDSKNPDSSWVAGCVSMFYWLMSRFYNCTRNALGMSAALNGTGFMVSAKLIKKHGFDTISLTEDLEYTAQCAINGVKIGWMHDAIIYDEQPIRMIDSYRQRRRWSAGTVQCLKQYGPTLVKRALKDKSLDCFDIFTIFGGAGVQVVSLIPFAYSAAFLIANLLHRTPAVPWLLLATIVSGIGGYIGSTLLGLLVCITEKKLCRERIPALVGFCFFLLTWIPANLISLVRPAPKWKAIPHTVAIDASQVQKRN